MKLKYQISLFVIITLLIINSSLATSYSLWMTIEKQEDSNTIIAGCFDILFNDLDSNNISTSISLLNTYPLSNEVGMRLSPYTVKIKNNCSIAASYKLLINTLNDNTLEETNLNYYLKKNNVAIGPANLGGLTPFILQDSTKTIIENEKNVQIKNSYVLSYGTLNPTEEITYELRLWVKEEATDVMEKEFKAVVALEAYASNPHS